VTEPNSLHSLRKSRAAHLSWAATEDRPARTAKARRAADDRFLKMAGGDPKRAESLRRAHYQKMTIARLEKRAARKHQAELEAAQRAELDDGPV
jgi:hypothetical protein